LIKPFLKWVGGKRSILPQLKERLPITIDTYVEPFLGGGALYFGSQNKQAYLSDINNHLIDAYIGIRDRVFEVMEHIFEHQQKHCDSYFMEVRNSLHLEENIAQKAAGFIYLNKTCYGGMYRENKQGEVRMSLNKQYKYVHRILDTETLLNASKALQNTKLSCGSFTQTAPLKSSFYYLDPPYHQTWSGYHRSGFGEAEHIGLSIYCKTINEVGGQFMLSNSDTDFVRNLYKNFHIEEVYASRSITPKLEERGRTKELLIRNYG